MSILDWLRERRELALQKRKRKARDDLACILQKMRETDNQGLLLRQLIGIPEVRGYSHTSGRHTYCDVTMHDGYTLTGYGYWDHEVIRDAIHKVVQRLKEKHSLHG